MGADGRLHSEDAERLRRLMGDGLDPRFIPDSPVELFGPWASLTSHVQKHLRSLVEEDTRTTMDWFPRGSFLEGLVRGGWGLERYLTEGGVGSGVREALIQAIILIQFGPLKYRARRVARAAQRRWAKEARPNLGDFLHALGRNPQWLLGDFAEDVAVDPRARGFYFDPVRNTAFGYVIGLDLLWTGTEMICLEGNLQRGIQEIRREIQPDHPIETGMVEAAVDHGARKMLWLEGHRRAVESWFRDSLQRRGRDAGVEVEFIDDPRKRRSRLADGEAEFSRKALWLEELPSDSLVVRRNEFPVASDFVINDKEPFIRGLSRALAEAGETRVTVLDQTRLPPEDLSLSSDGLPNLVYKYPDGLGGAEVFFLRARDRTEALSVADSLDRRFGRGPGIFQRFAAPDLLPGRRVWDMSAEIFVSPRGVWFLGAIRREASLQVPTSLESGLIEGPGILTSNQSTGGTLHPVHGEELDQFREASMVVGEAIRSVLSRTFQDRPTTPSHRYAAKGRPDR